MGVTFNEEQQYATQPESKETGLAAMLIRSGYAKDKKQANVVLFSVAVVAICGAFLAAVFLGPNEQPVVPVDIYKNAQP